MRMQDMWTGEAAGLQQCSTDPFHIHRGPLQCWVIRQLGVVRRVRAAPPCCPLIASHYSAELPDRSVLRGACEQRGRTTRRDGYRSIEGIISYS
jgi:hypothetical protein